MSDPFEALRHPDEGTAVPPLPAPEVRRRGDRMRRRRTAVRALGAACAVAVVATGGVALGGALTDAGPSPSPAPATVAPTPDASTAPSAPPTRTPATRPTRIPGDFPLAHGLPEPRFSEEELTGPVRGLDAYSGVRACDRMLFPTTDPADALSVAYQQPEDFRGRAVTTYADDQQAADVVEALRGGFTGCAREVFEGPPDSTTLTRLEDVGLGDESLAAVRTYEVDGLPAIGLELVHVVRVGNAVLVSSVANEGGATPQDVGRQLDDQRAQVAKVVEAMRVFAAEACGSADR